MPFHEREVAARMLARDAGVFVEVERRDIAKAVVLARALGDDVPVHAGGRPPCRQPEHGPGVLADCLQQDKSSPIRECCVVVERLADHPRSPRTNTRSMSNLSVRTTTSASKPASSRPLRSPMPRMRAGTSVAIGTTASRGS